MSWRTLPGVMHSGMLALTLALFLVGCQENDQAPLERLRPVDSMVIGSEGGRGRARTFVGTSQASTASRLSFNVSGTVREVAVGVGDVLEPGDLIAALDKATYEVEVERAEADLAQANAERRNADAEYLRVRQLYANANASRNELDAALASAESARASYKARAQSLELAELNRQYTRLTSTARCSIAELSIEANENVAAGEQVALLNCGDGWEVEIGVPESLIGAFHSDLPAQVRLSAFPDTQIAARVSEVGIASGDSTVYPVILALEEAELELRAGLAAEVSVVLEGNASSGAVLVPPAAVGSGVDGAFVFVLEAQEEGVAVTRKRLVTIGDLVPGGLEILRGLEPGDRLLTAGVTVARDGLRVRDR